MTDSRRRAVRGSLGQRVKARLLFAASWLACRLPEGPLVVLAEWAGWLTYRLAPERAAQARRNLRRVARYLAETGMADARTRAAATDPRALEELVRSAFRHHARYYLEILRAPALEPSIFDRRIHVENPADVEAAFARAVPTIFISGHLGPIELPGLYLAGRSRTTVVAPMETVGDPELQAWFERTRAAFGVRIVGLREARRELSAALKRGEHVGLVADRDISGGGVEVPFFGAPAPIPVGPAFLAIESGAPLLMAGIWRTGRLTYRGRLDEVPVATEGSRRERIDATLRAEAAAFERMIARAPDQWGAVFAPIWPDLEAEAAGSAVASGGDSTRTLAPNAAETAGTTTRDPGAAA
ncbi:MAG TPA: lysophospholipid acyltransferase family protein [Candidatus Limnocylindrales bacterium]|nr:lysophospholipid acyltransferase family protein [Candidatus Limnocylindrales bacterium]